MAKAAGVTFLSVTDHDTVAGLEAAEAAAQSQGISLVPGIELSAFISGKETHILGHFLDPSSPELRQFSERLKTERAQRMAQMVAKTRALGFPITFEDVLDLAQDAQLGRPHLARVLVEKGYCQDTREAFDRFLGDGKPAWVDRFRLSGEEAIAMIHRAGGAATVAHPGTSKLEKIHLQSLAAAGLDGLEASHSDHPPSTQQKYAKWAAELKLIPTAGSDFHGEKVAPGRYLGSASMPPEHFEALRARAKR